MNLHEVLKAMSRTHKRVIPLGNYTDLLTFNLRTKTIKNGKLILMENGKIIPQTIKFGRTEIELENDLGYEPEEFYSGVEKRYADYYKSVPTEATCYSKPNFVALKELDLSYEDIMNDVGNRQQTMYELEWFVIASALTHNIPWEGKHWWKSKNYKSLIVYEDYL